MKPGPVVPTPEGVSNGAPTVGGNGADTPPPTGISFHCAGPFCIMHRECIEAETCFRLSERLSPLATAIKNGRVGFTERPAILSWAPDRLPDESAHEHLGNALQAMAELESLLLADGDFTQDRRALVALIKRRIGWAREMVR